MDTSIYLAPTPLLDVASPAIARLVADQGWSALANDEQKIRAAYDFVRNGIRFGYNASDNIAASQVLADGYGQCNTKTTLLMALLRALQVPCRFHGAMIDKALQRGAVTGLWYALAPARILHSWAEVLFDGQWRRLEGVIIDAPYLAAVQHQAAAQAAMQGATCVPSARFVGYAIATSDITRPQVEWHARDTAIQQEGIVQDLGIYPAPDPFFAEHGVNGSPLKRFLFAHFVRHRINARVEAIRQGSGRR